LSEPLVENGSRFSGSALSPTAPVEEQEGFTRRHMLGAQLRRSPVSRESINVDRTATYDQAFFDRTERDAARSAEVVLPILFEWIGVPQSVLDVGCGTGAWLSVCQQLGVPNVLGLDGPQVQRDRLLVPPDRFVTADLTNPPQLGRHFDCALCLEVGEHLPPSAARGLVSTLCTWSDRVVFSAAVPGQGGVNHVNERPLPYWVAMFAEHDYWALDPIRPRVWQDPRVARFYSQNALLYCHSRVVQGDKRMLEEHVRFKEQRLTILYDNLAWKQPALGEALYILGGAVRRSVRRRLGMPPEGS